jgi:uncharacterized zinc-type alcohol dehydrogenase-like protein
VTETLAYAAQSGTSPLAPFRLQRREPGPKDVEISIVFCGVCHSDLHTVRSEWPGTVYPAVPGHEIVGRVARVGAGVTRFSKGDLAAVGCLVDSCRTCPECRAGLEQYCVPGSTQTYNSPDPHGGHTFGGYTERIVVDQDFVLTLPKTLDPAAAAPLLCAGITTYSPLKTWGAGSGKRVGVVGLGGLGHMAVKLANALGAEVVLFTTSPGKSADARRLGAHEVVVSKDAGAMARQAGRLDLIVDTVSAPHELDPLLETLKRDGTLCLVGGSPSPHPPHRVTNLIMKRRRMAGSLIGGIKETQEMLDFCAARGIGSDIEMIPIQKIEDAYDRMLKSDVRYRFVIDMASLRA